MATIPLTRSISAPVQPVPTLMQTKQAVFLVLKVIPVLEEPMHPQPVVLDSMSMVIAARLAHRHKPADILI